MELEGETSSSEEEECKYRDEVSWSKESPSLWRSVDDESIELESVARGGRCEQCEKFYHV